ncbi:bifunctional (p)ppGpp synthetase/guanosine-3',5'-bis(diphosphate) 3'-pyrophosphohydrolase [Candidatus Pacearchaeota archaeon]|nr:bifunctional (p)ppGpp synthetase/guanosine-3',5'-bis(diphosphate) 3'-pyrophosphohydrolase [Candidatus Pacearchaeota archaeon]
MPNRSEFLRLCEENEYSKREIDLFRKALDYSKEQFKAEKRLSGELVMRHNIEIGKILVKSKLFPEVVVAGILYGGEGKVLPTELQKEFGKEISDLVYGQSQLKVIKSKNENVEAETLRKILLVTIKDVRIIFVKLADKLDNLKTMRVLPEKEQRKIAEEVLEVYAPLANRFGLEYIRRRLEERAFKILNLRRYNEIVNFLKDSKENRQKFVKDFIGEVSKKLGGKAKIVGIKGREKHIYSIYKKLHRESLHNQRDHFAIRIIAKSVDDCYKALGILHENYEGGRLKDYIASPKPNGYQSLHTTLNIVGKYVEVQIRTQEMEEVAEEGVASHWSYKKLKSDENFEKKTAWLRSVLDLQANEKDKEFLKTVKLNVFGDKIYCYTPQGKAIDLPKGSTILDFAYQIHQEVGNRAVGGRIDGIYASLRKELKNGEVVEIMTNKNQRPRRDWVKFVVSARARSIIRKEVKRYEKIPVAKHYSIKESEKEKFDDLTYSLEFPNHKLSLAKCCSPIPKNEIVGVIKSHRKISVHVKDCKRIKEAVDRIIPVFWKETFNRPIKIIVEASDRSGILADMLNTISRGGFVVKEANAKLISNGASECSFVIVPQKLEHIVNLIKRIKKVRGVQKIWFE